MLREYLLRPIQGVQLGELHYSFGWNQDQTVYQKISRETPILDNIDGFWRFYEGTKNQESIPDAIKNHAVTDILFIGESGIGKGAAVEQTLQRLSKDKSFFQSLSARRRSVSPTYQYYSLAAEFADAVVEKGVVSPWGEFTPEELAEGAVHAAELGREKLARAEAAPSPIARLLDFVAVADPIDLGSSLIVNAVDRANRDPTYTYRIIALTTQPEVQQATVQTRKLLWQLPESATSEEVRAILKSRRVRPDTKDISLAEIRTSFGAPVATEMVHNLVNEQMYKRQNEIREHVNRMFPHVESPSYFEENPDFIPTAQESYYQLLLFHDWKAEADKVLIANNPFLEKRNIPLYRKLLREYRIR